MLNRKIIIGILICLNLYSCDLSHQKEHEIVVFHAGSLSLPFKEMAAQFEQENPQIKVLLESAGSRQCARKIIDLKRECDIMASADYKVIDNLLIPQYADWNIKFAGNEMAIVFHEKSRESEHINAENWYEILMKEELVFGRSNPDFDPCGYRAVLCMKLAEDYYQQEGLAERMLAKDLNFIRPKEVDLIGLLETNIIDYLFLYRSVAEQHGLDYIVLPDSINLNNPTLAKYYAQAQVDISGKKPGEFITKTAEAMVYGLTILNEAPNRKEALMFVDFILSAEKGMKIMQKNGQKSLVPSPSSSYGQIPKELQGFALRSITE